MPGFLQETLVRLAVPSAAGRMKGVEVTNLDPWETRLRRSFATGRGHRAGHQCGRVNIHELEAFVSSVRGRSNRAEDAIWLNHALDLIVRRQLI